MTAPPPASMTGALDVAVTDVAAQPYAATPTLLARLDLTAVDGGRVQSVNLHVQVQIEVGRRAHDDAEQRRLRDLFGVPARWGRSVRALPWTIASVVVPGFTGTTTVDVPLPVTYDFDVTAARYLHALSAGDVPLLVLCSGTVFHQTPQGLRASPIPWSTEATYAMPVSTWRDVVDAYFPDSAWLRLDRDTLDALAHVKAVRALPSIDAAVRALIAECGEGDAP